MKKLFILLLALMLFFFVPREALAIYNPEAVPNNHFGMHIIDTSDIPEVAKLVNSNGGDWGYVTLVIQKGERNVGRWQKVFDEMRRLHLIPIVRIATAPLNGDIWEKPNVDEIDGWVSFLNSLNWVIENRYVTVGNEPNHDKEWGGGANPKEYADYLKIFSEKLKKANDDFFIMPAGLDASANNPRDSVDETTFLKEMIAAEPNVFENIDGWASHSYPNPNFSGSAGAFGRGTVRTYLWELDYLKSLGVSKNFPVFITETGWIHSGSLTTDIGPKIEKAYIEAWSDERVVAVTPFVFNYSESPFDIFSLKSKSGEYYDFYYNVLGLAKIKGEPVQIDKGEILTNFFPKLTFGGSDLNGVVFAKNTGQTIWGTGTLGLNSHDFQIESVFPPLVEPTHIAAILVKGHPLTESGNYTSKISLTNNSKTIGDFFETSGVLVHSLPTASDIFVYIREILASKLGLR